MIKTAKIARGLMALVAAGGLALAMMLAAPGKALAVDPPTADNNVVTITKKLVGATPQLPASEDFTFTFTKVSVNDLTDSADLDTMPAISNLTISIGTDTGKYISKKTEGATTTLRNDGTVDIKNLTFNHAGVYVYKVVETGSVTDVTMSQAQYTLRIYVKNGTSGPEIDKVTVEKDKTDDGTTGSAVKVAPNPNPANPGNPDTTNNPGEDVNGGSGFAFVNTMTVEEAGLTIAKTVTGEMGDKTKDFAFSMTITVPSTATPDNPQGWIGTIDGSQHFFKSGVATQFTLHHDQSLVFTDLPVGTMYTYTETGISGYTPTASTISNAGQAVQQVGTQGTNFVLDSALVGKQTNSSTLTNAYKDVTPTGIAISVLPFLLMIAVPVLAAAGYLFAKRRRSANVTNA